ncbi:MAG: M23 family metallopeptidase [Treponema sp.]
MSRIRGYKKTENNIVRYISKIVRRMVGFFFGFLRGVIAFGQKKLTIMIVPHSQKKVINFQTSIFSVLFVFLMVIGMFTSFFWFTHKTIISTQDLSALREENKKTQASLDVLREETNEFLKSARNFQAALTATFSSLGLKSAAPADQNANGDLSFLFNMHEVAEGSLKETAELKQLASYFNDAVSPVQEMGKLLNAQTTLFSDIPSLWPIKGGIGHISMAFGQNRHPFTGKWYIHKGIDLSTYRSGDAIVATADGQVVTVEYDPGWGNYVIIKHKHGFYTRYAHMQSYRVKRGEFVQQGQTIGYIGTSGLSTGPHLHYEVHIGSDVVDPIKYLNIKSARTK